ncbi:ABC transporter substrate-binding protein [Acidaminobacter sp. JC074]|uniref:ABC transporter substrate-binding protein n=1 Tax=Acidaminobacter sp. JC074 TaxID=2530199 RepID=UPI001F0DEE12|nr:extracellular solute-binding protein [Acidaminobacter sp. JC074]
MKRHYLLTYVFIGIAILSAIIFYMSTDRLTYSKSLNNESDLVTIRFSSSWAGLDSKAAYLERVIAAFEEENPGIRIMNESMYGEDFLFTLKADFASGNGPDVFGVWPGSDLDLLIENGMVADLKEVLDQDETWSSNFDSSIFEFMDQGDHIYSIPFEVIYEGLYYNKDLFEDFEVDIPYDYESLLEAVRAFKKKGIIPIAYNMTPEGSFIYQNIVVQLAGVEGTENPLKNGQVEDGYIEAMYKMRELYQMGAFPRNALNFDDASRNMLFIDKRAAMIVQGSWFNSGALDESVGLIPFPMKDDKYVIYGIGNGNFHMNQNTYDDPVKKQAALKFLKYLTSESGRRIFNESPSFIGTRTSEDDDYLKVQGLKLIEDADYLVKPPDHFINRTFWENVLIKDFPAMLEGEISPEEIFDKLHDYQEED